MFHSDSSPISHEDDAAVQQATVPPARQAVLTLGMDVFFNARHFVVMDGKSGPVHAHSFRVNVKICQAIPFGEQHTFILGFAQVRNLVQSETNRLNDTLLNSIHPFNDGGNLQPTTEALAAFLYHSVEQKLPSVFHMDSLSVWESPTNCATYSVRPV